MLTLYLTPEMMDLYGQGNGKFLISSPYRWRRKEVNDSVRIKPDKSGSYDDIVPNIKEMIKRRTKGKTYYVRGTFTRGNIDFYEDVMAMVNEGFKELSIEPVVLENSHPLSLREEDIDTIFDNYDKLYEEMKRRKREGNEEFKFYHFNIYFFLKVGLMCIQEDFRLRSWL